MLISPSSVSAEPISLTFEAHGFTISGEFVGYFEDGYVLMTENGEVHVPAAMVTCEGPACLEATQPISVEG